MTIYLRVLLLLKPHLVHVLVRFSVQVLCCALCICALCVLTSYQQLIYSLSQYILLLLLMLNH